MELLRTNKQLEPRVIDREKFTQEIVAIGIRFPASRHMELLKKLKMYLLDRPRVSPLVKEEKRPFSQRLFLLRESITNTNLEGMEKELKEDILQDQALQVIEYRSTLKYDYFKYEQILSQILPSEIVPPSRFDLINRIAVFCLEPQEMPFKYEIAEVYLDKHKNLRGVINVRFNPDGRTELEVLRQKSSFSTQIEIEEIAIHANFDLKNFNFTTRMRPERQAFMVKSISHFVEAGPQFPMTSLLLAKRRIKSTVFCFPGHKEVVDKNVRENGIYEEIQAIEAESEIQFFQQLIEEKLFTNALLTNHFKGLGQFLHILELFSHSTNQNWKAGNMPTFHLYIHQSCLQDGHTLELHQAAKQVKSKIEDRLKELKNSELTLANFKEMNVDCDLKLLNSVYNGFQHLFYFAIDVPCFNEKMENTKRARKIFQKLDEKQNVWSSSLGSYHMSYPGKQAQKREEGPLFDSVQDSLEFGQDMKSHPATKSGQSYSIRSLAKEWKEKKDKGLNDQPIQEEKEPEEKEEIGPPIKKKTKLTFGERLAGIRRL